MASSYGVQSSGFVVKPYTVIEREYQNLFKTYFGSSIKLTSDSWAGVLIELLSYQDSQMWNLADSVYSAHTLSGADGIYLDNLLNLRGIYRNAATASSGYAIIKTDSTAPWTETIPVTTKWSAENDISYYATEEQSLRNKVAAYTLTLTQATTASTSTIAFYVKNATSGTLNSTALTTSSSTFLTDLVSFLQANCATADVDYIYSDSTTVYVGFESDDTSDPVGLASPLYFYSSIICGNKWSQIEVEASETGKNALAIGGITGISPTPTGFSSVSNFKAFDAGTDSETDTEYIARFNSIVDEATAATKPAIYAALTELDGVSKAKIWVNTSNTDNDYSAANSMNAVVIGGIASDIAECLATTKAITDTTYGTSNYTYTHDDGVTEVIYYTTGSEVPYYIKITYQTVTGLPLSSGYQTDIQDALVTLAEDFQIGGTTFNAQLKACVFNSLPTATLTSLTVSVSSSGVSASDLTEDDITVTISELMTLSTDNIVFVQEA